MSNCYIFQMDQKTIEAVSLYPDVIWKFLEKKYYYYLDRIVNSGGKIVRVFIDDDDVQIIYMNKDKERKSKLLRIITIELLERL